MEDLNRVELLERQIQEVYRQLGAQERRAENTRGTLSLLRTLRRSLRALSAGVDPSSDAESSFILAVSEDGDAHLRHHALEAEILGDYLKNTLNIAGIELEPGQCLRMEPEFAKRLIEERLGETLAEQYGLDRRRGELQTALKQSSGPWRDELLEGLRQLGDRKASLLSRNVILSALHAAAHETLQLAPSAARTERETAGRATA